MHKHIHIYVWFTCGNDKSCDTSTTHVQTSSGLEADYIWLIVDTYLEAKYPNYCYDSAYWPQLVLRWCQGQPSCLVHWAHWSSWWLAQLCQPQDQSQWGTPSSPGWSRCGHPLMSHTNTDQKTEENSSETLRVPILRICYNILPKISIQERKRMRPVGANDTQRYSCILVKKNLFFSLCIAWFYRGSQ